MRHLINMVEKSGINLQWTSRIVSRIIELKQK
jgi:hypothetical protein